MCFYANYFFYISGYNWNRKNKNISHTHSLRKFCLFVVIIFLIIEHFASNYFKTKAYISVNYKLYFVNIKIST